MNANRDAAVRWLLDTPLEKRPAATISLLREIFGLTPKQAIEAIKQANASRYGLEGR